VVVDDQDRRGCLHGSSVAPDQAAGIRVSPEVPSWTARGGVSFTEWFTPTAHPTLALPLGGGRGFWMIGILTQRGSYTSAAGLRAKTWPDGNQVAHPDVTIEVGTSSVKARARVADTDERARIWATQKERMPHFAGYEKTAAPREIPVIVLDPVA
jgi:deazaflavin-dependent oxidoreductase (nitroreductase family)